MAISRQTEEQVLDRLSLFIDAVRDRRGDLVKTMIAPEFTAVLPGHPERYASPAEFVDTLPTPFVIDRVEVRAEGTIAWVFARMVVGNLEGKEGWFSAVLRGTGHAWLIAQVHGSLSA
ncbi:MAG: nuclear transport factor 2 family protein [Methanoregulaceae archaeon]